MKRLISVLLLAALLMPTLALAQTCYTLYIGTNDKDDYAQHIATEEAMALVEGICAKYIAGWTSSYATGAWTDENGVIGHENTLVISIVDATEEQVHTICDEAIAALNQNSILIVTQEINQDFYSGPED